MHCSENGYESLWKVVTQTKNEVTKDSSGTCTVFFIQG